jgi:hypothetical protein
MKNLTHDKFDVRYAENCAKRQKLLDEMDEIRVRNRDYDSNDSSSNDSDVET